MKEISYSLRDLFYNFLPYAQGTTVVLTMSVGLVILGSTITGFEAKIKLLQEKLVAVEKLSNEKLVAVDKRISYVEKNTEEKLKTVKAESETT